MSDLTETTTLVADRYPPGTVIADKYEVESVIGAGGMGMVLAARHVQLGQRVAIKVLRDELVKTAAADRFMREARAAVALRSEHVAHVNDVGSLDDGTPYIIMEHLEGTDLATLLDERGPLPPAEAVDYVLQALVAIAEAHDNGLVHRDLKPENLFLTRTVDGAPLVKVLDFGIAKALDGSSVGNVNLTATGLAMGTPTFMSPEQVRDSKSVDRRTDIWSMGAVLYQLLAGEPPFVADTLPAICAIIYADPPTPMSTHRDDVPGGLVSVIDRCLEKKVGARYSNVSELAQALEPFASTDGQSLVGKIARIVGGPVTLPLDRAAGWSPADAHGATIASSPGVRAASPASDGAAVTLASPKPSAGTLGPTEASRLTEGRPTATRTVLPIAAAVAIVGIALGWLALRPGEGAADADAPAAESAPAAVPGNAQKSAATSAADAAAAAKSATAPASAPPSASSAGPADSPPVAQTASSPASARPTGAVKPPGPKASTALTSLPSKQRKDLLNERK